MKKNKFIPVLTLTAVLGVGVTAGVAGGRGEVSSLAYANEADNWVVGNGSQDLLNATDVTGGVKIDGLHAHSAEMRTATKIRMDGLKFTFSSEAAQKAGKAIGFNFSQSEGFSYTSPFFSIWNSLYSGQHRFQIAEDHDYNKASKLYQQPSTKAKMGFGVAGSLVMNSSIDDALTLQFDWVNPTWYSITITETTANQFWGDNANYVKDANTGLASVKMYIPKSEMPVDENNMAYMHVIGLGSNTIQTAYITDFVEGTDKGVPPEGPAVTEDFENGKADINALDANEYPDVIKEAIELARAEALVAVDSATKPSEIETIVVGFKNRVTELYDEYAGFESLSEGDPTANLFGCWGGDHFGKRFNDEGGVMISFNAGYGLRAEFNRQYDMLNMSITTNLSKIPVGSIAFFNFSPSSQDYFNNNDKYFNIEFLRINNTQYIACVSNTDAHNISVDDWNTDTHTQFKGVIFDTVSGTVNISSSTSEGVTTLTVNGTSKQITTQKIAKTSTDTLKAYVQTGVFNTSGRVNYLVESISDADSIAYNVALADTVAETLETIEDAKTSLLATVSAEGLNDDTIDEYRAELTEALYDIDDRNGLDIHDYNKYVGAAAAAAKEAVNAPVAAYEERVASKKAELKTLLTGIDADLYRDEEKELLAGIIEEGVAAIDEATSMAAAKEAYDAAIAKANALKTDAMYALEEAKVAAKDTITTYLSLENYLDDQIAEIQAIIKEAKTNIDAATTIEAVNSIVATTKTALDAVKTEATLVAEAKTAAIAELNAHISDLSKYTADGRTEIAKIIADGTTAINAADTLEDVATALAAAKASLDAVKTEATLVAEAKAAAIAELDSYIEDLTVYSKKNQGKIADAIETGKTAINAADTLEGVATALAEAKAALDAIPQGQNGCGGSIIAGSAIISAAALAGLALTLLKKKED